MLHALEYHSTLQTIRSCKNCVGYWPVSAIFLTALVVNLSAACADPARSWTPQGRISP